MAYNIARWTFLAFQLVRACKESEGEELALRIQMWRKELQRVLVEDGWLFGGRTHRSVASSVTEDFPPMDVVRKYVKPETSWSRYGAAPNMSNWRPCLPDLALMTKLCERMFLWGTNVGLQNKFCNCVWPGVCLRTLLLVSI